MLVFQVGASIPGSVGAVLNDTTYLPVSTVTHWKAALGGMEEKVLGSELVQLHVRHRAAVSHARLSWHASPSYSHSEHHAHSHQALVSLASLTTTWHCGAIGHGFLRSCRGVPSCWLKANSSAEGFYSLPYMPRPLCCSGVIPVLNQPLLPFWCLSSFWESLPHLFLHLFVWACCGIVLHAENMSLDWFNKLNGQQ